VRIVATTVVAGVFLAGLAIPAGAGAAKLKTRSATSVGSGNQAPVSATATCPKGTRAVGGGFSFLPLFTNGQDGAPILGESRKVGQRQWLATAFISDPGAPGGSVTVIAYVNCREGAPKTREVATAQSFPSATAQGLATTAACPGNRKATAGGFAFSNVVTPNASFYGDVTDSFRVGESAWTSLIETNAGGPSFTISTFAYCAKGRAPAEVSGESPPTGIAAPIAAQTGTCSKRKRPGAGGFQQTLSPLAPPPSVHTTYVHESLRIGKSWRSSGFHVGASSTLTALGYCSR
jgi:hypothetical protein